MERNCGPMDKNRIEGGADQGERARFRKALVVKGQAASDWTSFGRKSGGRAVKECVLTRGDLVLRLKGRRGDTEREVSRGRSSRWSGTKGQTSRRVDRRAPWQRNASEARSIGAGEQAQR